MAASAVTFPPHLSRFGLMGCCKGSAWSLVALESVASEVMIRGFVAQVCAKLVYFNNSPETLQVQAVFPVDESAAVYHCEAQLGGRTIITHCMEKKKAEKVYEEAVKAGQSAVMAREHGDSSDILKLNLGNLPGESRAEIMLKMVMELKVQTDGGISFVLPTVLNPRYCPPDHPMQDSGHRAGRFYASTLWDTTVYVPKPYSTEVKAIVSGSHKIAHIVSRTDAIKTTLADDALSAQVCQDETFHYDHDWSFLVYYGNPYTPHLLRETGDRSATGIMKDDLLMLNFFPEVPENSYSNKNEIIFVIDRSGSMQGNKIQNAKKTLLLFLKSLPAGCLFNVVSFGSSYCLLFPEGSRVYTQETLKNACNLQETMQADMGGTEILQPLKSIYSKPPIPGYSRQIILITDGEVWNVQHVCELVGRHAHETRVFSVGIGHGASTALVRGVARAGRGRSEMVVEENRLQEKVMGLVSSMVQENVQEVTIACEVEPVSRVTLVPKVPPVIFGGQHLILYARVPATTQVKSVTIRGQLGTKPLLITAEGQQIATVHDEAKSLHRLAARAQILQWQLDEEEGVAEDMVALSTASGVVCKRTALVGVDKDSGHPLPEALPTIEGQNYYSLECGPPTGFPKLIGGGYGVPRNAPAPTSFMMFGSAPARGAPAPAMSRMKRSAGACAAPAPEMFMMSGSAIPCKEQSAECLEESDESVESYGELRADCLDEDEDEVVEESRPLGKEQPFGLLLVVSLQQFDGSWTLKDAAYATGKPLDALRANNPAKGEVAWGTALVLAMLEKTFGEDKDQWALLATKARAFITGCGEQVEDLLAKARDVLQEQ